MELSFILLLLLLFFVPEKYEIGKFSIEALFLVLAGILDTLVCITF
jgi:hypothetical protein